MSDSQAYACRDASDPSKVRCMLLDAAYPEALVCASHLFKYSWRYDVEQTLGFKNINDPRNGLLLLK